MNSEMKLKITLSGIELPIWRTIVVDSSSTFYELHHIIQIAFGWQNWHMFEFEMDDYIITMPNPEIDLITVPANEIKLGKILSEGSIVKYQYDFGDCWDHIITVEEVSEVKVRRLPYCLDGGRCAPPEDCGGVPGYEHLVNVITNKKHPEHDEFIKFILDNDFSLEYFNIKEVNRGLSELTNYIKEYEDGHSDE
ncbi:MAG: plasmid pRiA4b ORF-3 family protein [Sphingobacteriaceae bacterium]|nr:plasmid pRiA4b ORF-3 family protein [Sphingobacteriaceae bacterium]MBK7818102.1 plasmid pRiA4b ORF-3 family protein [Sphingobacteriaceae bacterium]